jgi:hypothetical protein
MRLSGYIDGFLKRTIAVDGLDVTERLLEMMNSKYGRDIRIVMTQGITFGGFNVLDIRRFARCSGTAVIVISRKRPNIESMRAALEKHFEDWEYRYSLLTAVPIEEVNNGEHTLWIQRVGISYDDAIYVLRKSTVRGAIPEPVRIAHLVASAMHFGESRGKP